VSPAPAWFRPRSLDEAVQRLVEADGEGLVVGGATALSILLHHRLVWPTALVALRWVPGLGELRLADGVLRIGALVTHAKVAADPLVSQHLPVLAEAFGVVANHRVRAAATVGGVLAEADHASDPPAVLFALDARVVAAGPGGERRIPVRDLITGHYETSLGLGEIIRCAEVPIPPEGTVGTYLKHRSTSSEDRPCVSVAALVRASADGVCHELRVCVGAASEIPLRLPEAEAAARGRRLDAQTADDVAEAYAAALAPVADVRGTKWYRRELTRVLVARALLRCSPTERGATA
jgi:aerobic carbon-monoxide dehydrogenase medium subunit